MSTKTLKWVLPLVLLTATCALHAEDQPAAGGEAPKGWIPKLVQGKWIYGTVGALTYWDTSNGQFLGSGRGSAGIYEFNPDGTYKEYVYIEVRMYNMLTQVWTTTEGTVTFQGDTYTVRPTKGHYKTAGTRTIDRPMTDEELKKGIKTYKWKLEKDSEGRQKFIVPFDDGSRFEYRRQDEQQESKE